MCEDCEGYKKDIERVDEVCFKKGLEYNKVWFYIWILGMKENTDNSSPSITWKMGNNLNTWTQAILDNLALNKAKQEQYYGKTTILSQVNNNELVGIGWDNFLHDKMNLFVQVDIDDDYFTSFFDKVKKNADNFIDSPPVKAWMESLNVEIDTKLLCHLFAYTLVYRKIIYKDKNIDIPFIQQRNAKYNVDTFPKISEIFKENLQLCAEQSIVAQKYLQDIGFDSKIISWEVIWHVDKSKYEDWDIYGEPHTFLLITNWDQTYIFDPTNPLIGSQNIYPRISKSTSHQDMLSIFTGNQKKYIKTEDILWKNIVYYGTWDGTNIYNKDIIE